MEVVSARGALCRRYQQEVLCVSGISIWGALCRWYQQEVLCVGGISKRCSV